MRWKLFSAFAFTTDSSFQTFRIKLDLKEEKDEDVPLVIWWDWAPLLEKLNRRNFFWFRTPSSITFVRRALAGEDPLLFVGESGSGSSSSLSTSRQAPGSPSLFFWRVSLFLIWLGVGLLRVLPSLPGESNDETLDSVTSTPCSWKSNKITLWNRAS